MKTNNQKTIKPMRLISYSRVSTDNQKEEGTVNLQIQAIADYCKTKNLTLVEGFKDEGVSGGLEDRPGLASLFAYLESPEGKDIDGVIIWKLDRLARDLYIQEHLIKKLEQLQKRLISTKEPDLDGSDPMRKAFRQFMGIVAELEKAFITMRLSGGRLNKARKGTHAGGSTALGYQTKNQDLLLDNAEADTIRAIFTLKRNKHLSLNGIARHLNDNNYKTKRGGKWYASTLAYILGNQLYRGIYAYKGIETERGDLRLG